MNASAPDHERRAEDQDPGLAQRLAEERRTRAATKTSPRPAPQNLAMSPNEAIQSRGTASQARAHHLITEISGWVASSVWVKT